MRFGEAISDLLYDVAGWMLALDGTDYPLDQLGDVSDDVSFKLRTLAIAMLLANADTDGFCHNLMRSGRARVTFLSRCATEDRQGDYHLASGRFGPLLDTLAAHDFNTARMIAEFSSSECWPRNEYEDDYCYAQILHRLVQSPGDRDGAGELLEKFENALGGAGRARFELCVALVACDQRQFDDAFAGFLSGNEAAIGMEQDRGGIENVHAMARRAVFVEGLAILNVARHLGISTVGEYAYCPELARLPASRPFPVDDPVWPARHT